MDKRGAREFVIGLGALGGTAEAGGRAADGVEFHVSKAARDRYGLAGVPYATAAGVTFADYREARAFASAINGRAAANGGPVVKAGAINAMGLLDEILHAVCALYRERVDPAAFDRALGAAGTAVGSPGVRSSLAAFSRAFPTGEVYAGRLDPEAWLDGLDDGRGKAAIALEELLLLRLANENPALAPYRFLFDDAALRARAPVDASLDAAEAALAALPPFGPDALRLPDLLRAPMRASPRSLAGQLEYVRRRWGLFLGDRLSRLLGAADMLAEDERGGFPPGPGPIRVPSYASLDAEYERFSEDKDWMPRVVMMAKSTLVWLDQLSKAYGRSIRTLDAIPDEELDLLASRGFNALWLIGLWERSQASRRIKELCGNPEAAPSAYSLFDYEIAWELGGWDALGSLRERALARGIRLAADMVPNHTGIDSAWVRDRPDLFVRRADPPFPSYSYTGENLSGDGAIGIWLEDHYYDRRDAAVTFKRVDFRSGETSYVYHGNDGTSMPWNDTAQIDFLNPAAREAVKERILHVAKNFPIIRFDAAMVLAKRSLRRLWYPEPGSGGAIASRFESAMPADDFNAAMPEEFWREVVDRCAAEAPDTLLLAEAFWMMEGYFVRTLGMHRVYNSAFMNMLKDKKNAEYRATIRNTIEFDKDILKRFVNFMNNPDEETAVAQFGDGDRYFGVCAMMATMPGLPMFGHGQFEGFSEKYGMEYRRAYRDESPNEALVRRHERDIVPLLKRRHLFSGVERFLLYDLVRDDGSVDENAFAYSNGHGAERALVLFNNEWERTAGTIRRSCPFADKRPDGTRPGTTMSLAEGLGLSGRPGRFVIMTEAGSWKRYLRRSDDLVRDGLRVALEGFQCQVFVDVVEVDDDEAGSYARLCDALGGRGAPDLGWALQDLDYAAAYDAWKAALGAGYFGSGPRPSAAPEATAAFIAAFAAVARPGGAAAPADYAAMAAAAVEGRERLERAVAVGREGGPASAAPLAARVAAVPGAREAAFALAALLPIAELVGGFAEAPRARALAESAGMGRKLREAMADAGVDPGLAESASGFAVAMLGRLDQVSERPGGGSGGLSARASARAILADDEARALFGVNRWNDENWIDAGLYRLGSTLYAIAAAALGGLEASEAAEALSATDRALEDAGWSLDRAISARRRPAAGSALRAAPRAARGASAKKAAGTDAPKGRPTDTKGKE